MPPGTGRCHSMSADVDVSRCRSMPADAARCRPMPLDAGRCRPMPLDAGRCRSTSADTDAGVSRCGSVPAVAHGRPHPARQPWSTAGVARPSTTAVFDHPESHRRRLTAPSRSPRLRTEAKNAVTDGRPPPAVAQGCHGGRRATSSGQRAADDRRRAASNGGRAASGRQRATAGEQRATADGRRTFTGLRARCRRRRWKSCRRPTRSSGVLLGWNSRRRARRCGGARPGRVGGMEHDRAAVPRPAPAAPADRLPACPALRSRWGRHRHPQTAPSPARGSDGLHDHGEVEIGGVSLQRRLCV